MKAYFLAAKNTWDQWATYRLNFVVWRFRNVLQLVTIYFLWFSILPKGSTFGSYSQSLLLTYILGTSIVSSIVFATLTFQIGDEINQGNLSNYLIRPVNYLNFLFAKDIGDKATNLFFSTIELSMLFLILRPPFFLQTNLFYILGTIVCISFAIVINYFFNLLIGFVGFWSSEVWAPRFIFFIAISFFAGGLFPLDILPKPLFLVSEILPFQYMLYFPLKIYLGQLGFLQVIEGFGISAIWVLALYFICQFVWKLGLRQYTAQGR